MSGCADEEAGTPGRPLSEEVFDVIVDPLRDEGGIADRLREPCWNHRKATCTMTTS